MVPRRRGADATRIDIGEIVANRTLNDALFDFANGRRQPLEIVLRRPHDVKRQPLCRLVADTRQSLQLVNQFCNGFCVLKHELSFEFRVQGFEFGCQRSEVLDQKQTPEQKERSQVRVYSKLRTRTSKLGTRNFELETVLPEHSTESRRQHATELPLHCLINLAVRFVDSRQNQILKHFDVTIFERLGVNLQRSDFVIAFHLNADNSTACRSIHAQFFHFFLHLFLHHLRLLHHLLNIKTARKFHRTPLSESFL